MTARTQRIRIPKGDYGYDLSFTCRDAAGNTVDISGYTIHFKVWTYEVSSTLLVDGVGGLTDPTNGVCYYTIANGNFDTVGEFMGEVEATQAGEVSSYQSFIVEVTESG